MNTSLVWDRWERLAEELPNREAIIHWDATEEPFRWTRGELLKTALNIAGNLLKHGVDKGDVCAIILRHNKLFYPVYMSVSAIGAVPAVLAYPNMRLHPEKFANGLLGITQNSGLKWILTERGLESAIKPLICNKNSSVKEFLFPLEWKIGSFCEDAVCEESLNRRKSINYSDPSILQHSSGTTGLQKGVILSHKSILEHVQRYSEAIEITPQDKIVSWLPLYHDMGLIAAFHLPMSFGIPIIQIDPFQWTIAPALLLHAISEEKATLAWLPNFAYNFMADRIQEKDMEGVRLESVRMFINCSECVRAESHERLYSRFAVYGLKKESLAACYAMAEATFAITQTKPGFEATKIAIDKDALSKGYIRKRHNRESDKIYVSSGRPISGCDLKVIDENGEELSEDRIGEIAVRSISMFNGYINNIEKTNEVIKQGWYLTGDYGFLHQGEYYIIGRKKDIIIVAGKNIYPEDIEYEVSQVAGVIPGRVVAFGAEDPDVGTEKICIIAETSCDALVKESLKMDIIKAAMAIDLTVSDVYLVPPRWLMKSSSGKPCRKTNKERILKNDFTTFKSSYS